MHVNKHAASAKSLQSYLRSVASDGDYSSTGRFTVDVNKQRMKLRLNQFADPTHYLLCCIRAGVTSGAEAIEIKSGYKKTSVYLRAPKELAAKELLEGVLGTPDSGETERLLGAAFQGGLNIGASKVRVAIPGGRLVLTADNMEVEPSEQLQTDCEIEFSFESTYRDGRKRCARELSAIYVRGAFCPIPLIMDGLSVVDAQGWEGLFSWQQSADRYGVHKDFAWLEAFMADEEETFLSGVSRRRTKVEYLGGERYSSEAWMPEKGTAFLRIAPSNQGARPRIGSFTRIGSKLEGPGYLFLVKQGVVMDPVEANLGAPAVGVVIRGDHLKTDASLFRAVEDDEFYNTVKKLQGQTRGLVYHLSRERKNVLLKLDEDPVAVLWKGMLSGLGGAGIGLITGPIGSLVIGGATFVLVTALLLSQTNDRQLVEREQRIRWELDTFVDMVGPKVDHRLRL